MNCVECQFPLRPRRRGLQEYPGTREHRGKGVCSTCWRKAYELRQREGVVEVVAERPFDVEAARRMLGCYLVERRRRLARSL